MTEPIVSPDGKFMWVEDKWVRLPSENNIEISDSIVQGGISQETNINLNYSDPEKAINNYVELAIDKIRRGDFPSAEKAFQSAKELDVGIALNLFEGKRAVDISEQYLHHLWEKVSNSVSMVTILSENNLGVISTIIDDSDLITPIIISEINRLDTAREKIPLEARGNLLEESFQVLESSNQDDEKADIDEESASSEINFLAIEDCLMQLKGLAGIFMECCEIAINVSRSQIGKGLSDSSYRLEAIDIKSKLSRHLHISSSKKESQAIVSLREKLPNISEVTNKFREESLQEELKSLKSELREIESMLWTDWSIDYLMYGQVSTSGDINLKFKHAEIRSRLIGIVDHTESKNWDIIKNNEIESENYDASKVSVWWCTKREISDFIAINNINKEYLDEHEKYEIRVLLETCYLVGENTGKIVDRIGIAWKAPKLVPKYYYELMASLGTVSSQMKSLRLVIKKILHPEDWAELHGMLPQDLSKNGKIGMNKYKKLTETNSSTGSNSECFIATAAYGDNLHWKIDVLRSWRDKSLTKNKFGRSFIRLYYSTSPPVAKIIEKSSILRVIVRFFLNPIVKIFSLRY